jgi:putative FmdB family regulatory protein
MPRYDYECTKCGHTFELEQRISDRPRTRCPKCRGKVIRVISGGGGVILKGNGFYTTDYRSESYKKAAKAEGAGSEGGSKSPEKKRDG